MRFVEPQHVLELILDRPALDLTGPPAGHTPGQTAGQIGGGREALMGAVPPKSEWVRDGKSSALAPGDERTLWLALQVVSSSWCVGG